MTPAEISNYWRLAVVLAVVLWAGPGWGVRAFVVIPVMPGVSGRSDGRRERKRNRSSRGIGRRKSPSILV